MRTRLALLALLVAAPAAAACSWTTPEVGDVQATEAGLVWKRRDDLVRGEPGREELVKALSPFAGFVAAPDGQTIVYSYGIGGVGGDCRAPMTLVERWTPAGTTNLTDLLPGLPMAVHWPTARGIFANASGAVILDINTGATLATLAPGHSAGGIDYAGHSTFAWSAAWAPDGQKLALVTPDTAWFFRPDGSYLYDSYAGFPLGANGYGLAAFSADSRTIAVASMQGDRFTTLRTIDVSGSELRFGGAHLDTRGFRDLAWSPNGTLAVAWQDPQVYDGAARGNASVGTYDAALAPIGEHRWEGGQMGGAVSWEDADTLVVIVNDKIARIEPPVGVRTDAAPWRLPIPGPAPFAVVAIALAALRPRSGPSPSAELMCTARRMLARMTKRQTKPFLYARAERADIGPVGATFDRETIKNEGQ